MSLPAFLLGIVAPIGLGAIAGLILVWSAMKLERRFQDRKWSAAQRLVDNDSLDDGHATTPMPNAGDRKRRLAELRRRRASALRSLSTPPARAAAADPA